MRQAVAILVILCGGCCCGLPASQSSVSTAPPPPTPIDPALLAEGTARDLERAEANLAAAMEAQEKTVTVDAAKLYWSDGTFSRPVIAINVTNKTDKALKSVYFFGVLRSPDRTVPWAEDGFSYEPPGGLEPNESASWELLPNQFASEFRNAPRDRDDTVFTVIVRDFTTADGATVKPVSRERIEELQREVTEKRKAHEAMLAKVKTR